MDFTCQNQSTGYSEHKQSKTFNNILESEIITPVNIIMWLNPNLVLWLMKLPRHTVTMSSLHVIRFSILRAPSSGVALHYQS